MAEQDNDIELPDAPENVDDIVSGFFSSPELKITEGGEVVASGNVGPRPINPELPTGKSPVTTEDQQSPAVSSSEINPEDVMRSLDDLEKEIGDAKLEGKTQASINSFDGLKTRYKNKMGEIKEQLERLRTARDMQQAQLKKYPEMEAKMNHYDTLVSKVKLMEEELAAAKKEVTTNAYYRRKYDFENDPEIQKAFTAPMNDLKTRSLDIIKNVGLGEDVWEDLLAADSEYKQNHIIDSADISGLNAQSLKQYISQYKILQSEFNKASAPEVIDAMLEAYRGKGSRIAEETAARVFDDVKHEFSNHVKEIQYSDVNKEHNLFVHDKVVELAQTTYNNMKRGLAREYQNNKMLSYLSHAAIMAAAYPYQRKMVDHLLQDRENLLKEIGELTETSPISQSSEVGVGSPTFTTFEQELNFVRESGKKSVDDIATSILSTVSS